MKERDSDEKQLTERILRGERDAFREFIERYSRLVGHVVYRMIDNSADREDLCQDVFLKAYRHMGSFRHDSSVSTWLARIAYNTCINYLEKMKVPLFEDFEGLAMLEDYADCAESPADAVSNSMQTESVERAIRRLPPQFRTIVTLYHLDHLTYDQIGRVTGLPEGTVKSYLFRARKLLGGYLKDLVEKEGAIQ